jgi:hypothetical protein
MNIIKKALLAVAFTGIFSAATGASAAVITYDPVNDIALSKNGNSSTNFTFVLDGFNKAVDTINSAVLSIFLRDDAARDNETYQVTLGSTSTQVFNDNDLSDVLGHWELNSNRWVSWWEWVGAQPGSVIENISFNSKALTDFRADGSIKIFVEALAGDFIFEKAVLNVDVTKGEVGGSGNVVPEPATVTLFGMGLLGFAASRRKAAKK